MANLSMVLEDGKLRASPAYSVTVYLVTPINRQIEPDNYLGQTLVYQETYWHQCANRNETRFYDGPCVFENTSYWVSYSAVGQEVGKLHYDNFSNPYAGDPIIRVLPIVVVSCLIVAGVMGIIVWKKQSKEVH